MENKIIKDNTKIKAYDFMRVILTFFIFVYHYFIHTSSITNDAHSLFLTFEFSTAPTICFFIMSGALLYNRYKKDLDIKYFYKKRFVNVLLPYYIVYLYQYIKTAITLHTPFFVEGSKFKILLFIFALDGYMNKYFSTYHMNTGEWFLGILVIFYMIYPILVKLLDKFGRAFVAFIYILFIIRLFFPFEYAIKDFVFCLTAFTTGMFISKYDYLNMKKSGYINLFLLAILVLKFNGGIGNMNQFFYIFIYSVMMYLLIYNIGNMILKNDKNKYVNIAFANLSSVSYEFFLIHHIIILKLVNRTDKDKFIADINYRLLYFFAMIFITLAIGFILKKIIKIIINIFEKRGIKNNG